MTGGDIWNMTEHLSALQEYEMIIDKAYGITAVLYGHVTIEEMLKAVQILSEILLSSVPLFLEKVRDAPVFFPEHFPLCCS